MRIEKYLKVEEIKALNDIMLSNQSNIGVEKDTYFIMIRLIERLINKNLILIEKNKKQKRKIKTVIKKYYYTLKNNTLTIPLKILLLLIK